MSVGVPKPESEPLTKGVRAFIGLIFGLVGLSFMITTGTLIWEFGFVDALALGSFYSHLFLFFPTFGIVALIAFFTPACVFTDMYLRHVPWGRHRYSIGFVVVVMLSFWGASIMTGAGERSIFEISPEVLHNDRGEPGRLPVMLAVDNVRRVSQSRIGLSDLARNCRPDTLKDQPAEAERPKRYCFASTALPSDIYALTEAHRSTDSQCCRAQQRLRDAVQTLHDQPGGRSLTSQVHGAMLPGKIFFGLMLVVISVMLLVRHRRLVEHYDDYLPAIERGVLIGAAAMVVYPIMSHAFLQSIQLLYFDRGPTGGYRSSAPILSLLLGCWWVLLLLFFHGRQTDKVESATRIAGVLGGALAVLKYDQIIDVFVRAVGSGADLLNVALLCLAALATILLIVIRSGREKRPTGTETPTDRTGSPAPAARN
jgi:hypothetical protein